MTASVTLIVLSLVALATYLHYRHQQRLTLNNRFTIIIGLRQLIFLLRFHRRHTHELLLSGNKTANHNDTSTPLTESIAIEALGHSLLNQAETCNKPMYRITLKQFKTLTKEWQRYSLQRNQAAHGKAIRHVMYLIDDTLTQCLISNDNNQLFQRYQSIWPVTLNALDSLSRFRFAIQQFSHKSPAMQRELTHQMDILKRRMNHLAITAEHHEAVPLLDTLFDQVSHIENSNNNDQQTQSMLYHFSLEVSDTLFMLFDEILQQLGDELAIKLPEMKHKHCATIVPIQQMRSGH